MVDIIIIILCVLMLMLGLIFVSQHEGEDGCSGLLFMFMGVVLWLILFIT